MEKSDFPDLKNEEHTTGLCLSGGAALGFAHIGAIQALEDHGISIDQISGSSMGAVIGTMYAAGYSPSEMLQMIKEDKLYKITKLMKFHPTFLSSGLSKHTILRSLVRELIPHNSFEQLKKKMHICVVNLNTAEWEIINSGNKLDIWVAATSSIPGLFEVINYENVDYTDGGLLNNLPAQPLKKECDTIIGVNVIPYFPLNDLQKPIDTLATSVRAVQQLNSKEGKEICNFLIEPQTIKEYNEFNFEHYLEIYQYGYRDTTKFIIENPEILNFNKEFLKKKPIIQ